MSADAADQVDSQATITCRSRLACKSGWCRKSGFAWLGAALFLVLGIARAWHHEPWRDECGVWLLAHNCQSPGELVQNLRYGGHPYFWPLLAWLLAQATTQFFYLQLVHLLLACLTVFLVLRFAPWPRWEAALCVLGYFIFFEYAVVCRAYVLALLGAVLVAIAWQKQGDRRLLGSAGLFLLTQSSVYGIILALAFFAPLNLVAWQRFRQRRLSAAWCAAWLVPLASGTAIAVAMIVPPTDGGFACEWTRQFDPERAAQVAASAWRALVPIPDFATSFPWNSNVADGLSWPTQGALGGLAFVAGLWILRRDFLPLLFFVVAVLGICTFSYAKYPGSLRHHGHLYLALLVAMWLASLGRQSGLPGSADYLRRGLFALQAVAGIWIAAADWMNPFSANRRAAEWISAGDFGDYILAGSASHPVSGVGMHLRRPIYYLKQQRWGTFIVWDNRSRPFGGSAAMFRRAARIGDQSAKPVLLILNEELPAREDFRLQARFTDSLIRNERFFVYTRERRRTDREAPGEQVRR